MPLSTSENDTMTHIISIVALAICLLGLNAIEFYFDKTILETNLFFLAIQNITGLAGMSYYAVRFAITPNGVSIETLQQLQLTDAQKKILGLA